MDDYRYDPEDYQDEPLEEEEEPEQQAPVRRRRKKKNFFQRLMAMPPRSLLALAGIVVVLIVILALIAKGCSAKPTDGVTAAAFNSGTELTLPVSAELNAGDYLSYGGYQFETSKKIGAMEKLIKKSDKDVASAAYTNDYGTCYVFTKPGAFGTDSWCLYQKDPANTKNWYIFMGMHREVMLEDCDYSILLPLHLISDSAIRDSMGARVELGHTYSCGLSKLPDGQSLLALFQGFYEESGLYVVISNATGFTMYPKTDSSREMIFSFDDPTAPTKFMITVPVPKEPEPSAVADVQYMGAEAAEPVSLPESDALALSELLLRLESSFTEGMTESAVDYLVNVNDALYSVSKNWKDDTWSVGVETDGKHANLNAKDSCTVMALLGASETYGTPARDSASWPGDVDVNFAPDPCQMVTTADLRVRTAPSTSSNTLMTMPEGSSVAVLARNADGWCEIWYNDQLAYMSGSYLKSVD